MQGPFQYVSKHYAARTHDKMKEVLMEPDAPGPAVHYYMIRGGREERNVTIWEPGKVGSEYIKAYGHYHIGTLDETYWILLGEGVALLQKLVEENGVPQPDRVEEFRAVKVSAKCAAPAGGQGADSGGKAVNKIYMPSGFGHLVANTGPTYFVTADDSPVDFTEADPVSLPGHADYEMVRRMRGFAYYVVEHDDAPALVKNPAYKEVKKTDFGGIPVIK